MAKVRSKSAFAVVAKLALTNFPFSFSQIGFGRNARPRTRCRSLIDSPDCHPFLSPPPLSLALSLIQLYPMSAFFCTYRPIAYRILPPFPHLLRLVVHTSCTRESPLLCRPSFGCAFASQTQEDASLRPQLLLLFNLRHAHSRTPCAAT